MSNYDEQEHEVADYYAQAYQELQLEPTEPADGLYLLVDEEQVEEPVAFRSIDGAVEYAGSLEHGHYAVYQLRKVL
jgi:hypothetical protein